MKKPFVPGIALALTLSIGAAQIAAPRRAEAALAAAGFATGFATGGVPFVVLGSVSAAGAVAVMAWGLSDLNDCNSSTLYLGCIWDAFVAMGVVGLGAVLLDGQQVLAPDYRPLSPQDGQTLGLSPNQVDAYNGELDEINAVRESIESDVRAELQAGAQLGGIDVHSKWESYRNAVSPDAYAALEKVSDHLAEVTRVNARAR